MMLEVCTAKTGFTGTCKHAIKPGQPFLILERPNSLCRVCGMKALEEACRRWRSDSRPAAE